MTTVVASLWQGIAIAAGTALLLRCVPRVNAATRYVVWWMALGAVAALPIVHFASSLSNVRPTGPMSVRSSSVVRALELPAPPDWLIASIAGAWFGTVLIGVAGITRSLRRVATLKRRARSLDASTTSQLTLWNHARISRRRATVCVSQDVRGACVLGLFGAPTILLSDRFVSTLPADALDQIVLHEQAHLTRFDDWTRLAQAGITALLGLHPAIRFIDTQIDLEREAACDDIVVARTGGAARYASCLAQAADAVGFGPRQRPGALTPNVTGHGNLFVRVQRLLDPRMPRHARLQFASAATGLVALTAAATIGPIAPLVVIRGATAQPPAVYGEPGNHAFDWQSRAAGLPLLESPVGKVDNLSNDRVETDEVFHEQARVGSDARAMVTTPDAGTPSGDYLPIVDASADEPAGEPVPLRSRTLTSTAFPAPAIPVGTPGPPGGHESGWNAAGQTGAAIGDGFTRMGTATGATTKRAGAAVGGFFSRAGKAVAGSF